MTWRTRREKREGGMAHGITFVMEERSGPGIRAEAAVGAQKIHVDGTSSLTLALGQYRYGDELIAQVYTREEPRILPRRADGWSRIQVYLGAADEATAAMLERIAKEIRQLEAKA